MTDHAILEGQLSIRAALKAQSREIHRIYVDKTARFDVMAALGRLAREAGVPFERADGEFITSHASGKTHGGVIAFAGERKFVQLEDLLKGTDRPFVVMLDGFEDPFNFGQAVRSLYAAGADGIVVRPRNWTSAAAVVARSSAGASELMPMAIAETALDAASFFRERGLTVACTAKTNAVSIYHADLTIPLFLVIGGEKRGITRSFTSQADLLLSVPYGRWLESSLAAGHAAAVISFEVMRQRKHAKK
jgi:23S rRNA (guanosine2251-2'-O)-methyltransferase